MACQWHLGLCLVAAPHEWLYGQPRGQEGNGQTPVGATHHKNVSSWTPFWLGSRNSPRTLSTALLESCRRRFGPKPGAGCACNGDTCCVLPVAVVPYVGPGSYDACIGSCGAEAAAAPPPADAPPASTSIENPAAAGAEAPPVCPLGFVYGCSISSSGKLFSLSITAGFSAI